MKPIMVAESIGKSYGQTKVLSSARLEARTVEHSYVRGRPKWLGEVDAAEDCGGGVGAGSWLKFDSTERRSFAPVFPPCSLRRVLLA
jgi:hypothetical protein